MERDIRAWLGRRIQVVVDRRAGSRRPAFPELKYPINYDFVPGTLGADGEPLDAYLIESRSAVTAASGTVVAVVLRTGDESKLVVSPSSGRYARETLEALLAFQESFFEHEIVTIDEVPDLGREGEPLCS